MGVMFWEEFLILWRFKLKLWRFFGEIIGALFGQKSGASRFRTIKHFALQITKRIEKSRKVWSQPVKDRKILQNSSWIQVTKNH